MDFIRTLFGAGELFQRPLRHDEVDNHEINSEIRHGFTVDDDRDSADAKPSSVRRDRTMVVQRGSKITHLLFADGYPSHEFANAAP